ncbi:hypothetical protein [Nocardioides sp. OK12]|uniref:hypothetical protein n=1 Tax=Nocardioides sp. OK12 TaxID=2758661 RepID=UPI0021C4C4B5|nr:hypothetical protein [Nocardioides sp. OK12]
MPIAGTFSAANLAQVVCLALLLPSARLLSMGDVARWFLVSASIVLAGSWGSWAHGIEPKWDQMVFFSLVVWQLSIIARLAPTLGVEWRGLLRRPVNIAAAVFLTLAALDYVRARETPWLTMFFQDKSHAAVAAYLLPFLVLAVNASVGRFVVATAVYAASIATASRLVALGAPIFLLACLVEYRRSRKLARGAGEVYLHHLALLALPVGFYYIARSELAAALTERLGNLGAASDASLFAHFELIKAAWDLKWSTASQVFFGAGPGGFAPTAQAEGISLAGIAAHDPGAIAAINSGFAPIHSTNASILAEFPIWIFIGFVLLWWRIVRNLWRRRELTLLLLALGMLTVTTFYSSHNEFFYAGLLSVLVLVAFNTPPSQPQCSEGEGSQAGSDPSPSG